MTALELATWGEMSLAGRGLESLAAAAREKCEASREKRTRKKTWFCIIVSLGVRGVYECDWR